MNHNQFDCTNRYQNDVVKNDFAKGSRQDQLDKVNLYNSLTVLCTLKDPWCLLSKSNETLTSLKSINEINNKSSLTFDLLNESQRETFSEVAIDFLKYIYDNIKENMLANGCIYRDENDNVRFMILLQFTLIVWNWTDKSAEFCIIFHHFRGIRVLFKFLNDINLIQHLVTRLVTNPNVDIVYRILFNTYKAIIGSIHNLSKLKKVCSSEWDNVDAVGSLFNATKYLTKIETKDLQMLSYFAITNMVETCQVNYIKQLPNLKEMIVMIINLINVCGQQMTDETITIQRRQYRLNGQDIKEIAVVSTNGTTWRITELILFLARLADMDDELKVFIYEKHSLRAHLKKILYYGNDIEKEYILRLIWKLVFDDKIAKSIKNDIDMYSLILGLSINPTIQNKTIKKYCDLSILAINNIDPINSNSQEKRRESITKVYPKKRVASTCIMRV
jgi:hypothetical protein